MLRTDQVIPQHKAIHYDWCHDINGTVFKMAMKVKKDFPQFTTGLTVHKEVIKLHSKMMREMNTRLLLKKEYVVVVVLV